MRTWQTGVDLAEPRADGLDRQVQQLRNQRRRDQGDKRPWDAPRDPRPDDDDGKRRSGDDERPRIDGIERVSVGVPFREKQGGDRCHLEAEQIADLTREDDQRDAAGEADRHWIRDELDRGTEPEQAERDQDESGHERRDDQPIDAIVLHDPGDDDDEGAGRPADLDA